MGCLFKNRKELNIERIQSVDTSQNIVHQLLGGVSLSIKTPSDGIELDTITKSQSDSLSKYLKERKFAIKNKEQSEDDSSEEYGTSSDSDQQDIINEKEEVVFFRLSTKDLLKMSFTSGGILIVFAALGSLLGFVTQIIDIEDYISPLINQVVNLTFVIISITLYLLY